MAQTQRRKSSRPTKGKTAARPTPSTNEQGAELAGLALVAAGIFFAVVIWFGWDGGVVGGKLADVFAIVVGRTSALIPALFVAIGVLLIVRSDLVDVRPFRLGIAILALSLTTIFAAGVFGIGPDGPAPKTLDPSIVDNYGGMLG
ncbi:MAG: hypothetical protein ACR2OD_12130, partial [Gaiellaceae bacterium]